MLRHNVSVVTAYRESAGFHVGHPFAATATRQTLVNIYHGGLGGSQYRNCETPNQAEREKCGLHGNPLPKRDCSMQDGALHQPDARVTNLSPLRPIAMNRSMIVTVRMRVFVAFRVFQ